MTDHADWALAAGEPYDRMEDLLADLCRDVYHYFLGRAVADNVVFAIEAYVRQRLQDWYRVGYTRSVLTCRVTAVRGEIGIHIVNPDAPPLTYLRGTYTVG